MLTNPYFVALVIPIVLLLAGAFGKKLVRGSPWIRKDFYLGVEFTMAALSSAFVYIFDMVKLIPLTNLTAEQQQVLHKGLISNGVFIVISFILLLVVLSIHQDCENNKSKPKEQFLILGFVSNFIGLGLIAGFIITVKGIK